MHVMRVLLCLFSALSSSKNILSVKHILFECPVTTELFQKIDMTNAYNNVRLRDILYKYIIILYIFLMLLLIKVILSNRLFIVLWEN